MKSLISGDLMPFPNHGYCGTDISRMCVAHVLVMCTANVTITIPEELKREMKKRKMTNWSLIARRAFEETIRQEEIDTAETIDTLRASSKTTGWSGVKEIRKSRDASKSS